MIESSKPNKRNWEQAHFDPVFQHAYNDDQGSIEHGHHISAEDNNGHPVFHASYLGGIARKFSHVPSTHQLIESTRSLAEFLKERNAVGLSEGESA